MLLEDPDIQARVRSDPRAFLDALRPPVYFDEMPEYPRITCLRPYGYRHGPTADGAMAVHGVPGGLR